MRDLTTPVTDLYTGVSSLDGTVTVEGTRDGAKARIDATVLFGKDSAVLRPGARDRIRQVAKVFARNGAGKVLVVGYTDDLGPADHGLRLSIRRAGAVAATLADLLPRRGYPMTAAGKGEQDPAVPNTSEANRRKNRRVVITLDRSGAAGQGANAGEPTNRPDPTPEQTTVSAAPTPSRTPSATATPTPTPAPETVPPTVAPTPTASRSSRASTPDVTVPPAPPPAGADSGGGGPGLNPVLVSNLFLATILIAAAAFALHRRFRRPDNPGPAGAPAPDRPPSLPNDTAPQQQQSATGPTAADLDRDDGPRPDPEQHNTAGPAEAQSTNGTPLPRSATRRADIVFPTDFAVDVPAARHADPMTEPARGSGLDSDLRTWFSPRSDLPRLSLLGPVTVRAHGAPIARRRPFYTELLAFLALRPHGATPDQVSDAFSLTPARVRNDMKVLRDWLGTNPRTGRRHLPDARDTAAGRARGLAVYQVEGLLVDLYLFNDLRKRSGTGGTGAFADLDLALRLVQGRPFDQLRPHGWAWLHEGDRVDLHAEAAIQRAREDADQLRAGHDTTVSLRMPSAGSSAGSGRRAVVDGGHP